MTIQRWSTIGQYGATVYINEDDYGSWVLYKDYMVAIEVLEYEIRSLNEELQIIKEERNYYQDKCREMEERDLFSFMYDKPIDKK